LKQWRQPNAARQFREWHAIRRWNAAQIYYAARREKHIASLRLRLYDRLRLRDWLWLRHWSSVATQQKQTANKNDAFHPTVNS
jgi:hypothetical protein